MSLRRKLATARCLTGRDWILLAQAWPLLLLVDLGLRLLPFKRVQIALGTEVSLKGPAPEDELEFARQIARIVAVAAKNHLYPMTCLRRSLALQWLLKRSGIETVLRFGVRRNESDLSAHAWVEWQGRPVGDLEIVSKRFAPLVRVES